MKSVACICNTYFQIINAIQLKNTLFKECEVTCIISDHSKNSDKIAETIKQLGLFKDTVYIRTRYFDENTTLLAKAKSLLYLIGIEPPFIKNIVLPDYVDEMIYFRPDFGTACLFNYWYSRNHDLIVSRYDEGVLSLNTIDGAKLQSIKSKLAYAIRKSFGKAVPSDRQKLVYRMFAELYKGNFKAVRVPLISTNSRTSDELKKIFSLSEKDLSYPYKYIFFTSVYDFEGGDPIGEFDLVKKISELVGKKNILIKTHPRDFRTVYQDEGFAVDKNSAIPWEVIQLTGNFENKVFLTVNSGSVLLGNAISNKPVRSYFLYKLCDYSGNTRCIESVRNIENLLEDTNFRMKFKSVNSAMRIEELL